MSVKFCLKFIFFRKKKDNEHFAHRADVHSRFNATCENVNEKHNIKKVSWHHRGPAEMTLELFLAQLTAVWCSWYCATWEIATHWIRKKNFIYSFFLRAKTMHERSSPAATRVAMLNKCWKCSRQLNNERFRSHQPTTACTYNGKRSQCETILLLRFDDISWNKWDSHLPRLNMLVTNSSRLMMAWWCAFFSLPRRCYNFVLYHVKRTMMTRKMSSTVPSSNSS